MKMGATTRNQKPTPIPTEGSVMIHASVLYCLAMSLMTKHKFKPVNVDACSVPRACDVAETAYKQAPEDVWVAAKAVMGTKQSQIGRAHV